MDIKLKCCECNTELNFSNWGNIRDVNNKYVPYCKNCADVVLLRLKENRFIENYNGADIYLFEGRYYPYWGCAYSFDNIDDCRARIDMKHVAVVPTVLLNKVRRGESLL